ncbi:MAG TPA: carboxypeptidase-like regulatory domain-containing protein [Candidatus Acidoferrum sp.]|nr:carboxypeptidase-like regulatory domain-containing protein [Candidatus Acidoferrum sp.]
MFSFRTGKLAFCVLIAILLFTFVLAGSPAPLAAQAVNATVVGTVSDTTGAAIASVKVTITETNANISRTASANLLFAGYSSGYNTLQGKFERKFGNALSATTAYTFGKGMGFQTGDDGGLFFYIDQRRDHARNDFDRTQTFVQSLVYDLPFGQVTNATGGRTLQLGLKLNF